MAEEESCCQRKEFFLSEEEISFQKKIFFVKGRNSVSKEKSNITGRKLNVAGFNFILQG